MDPRGRSWNICDGLVRLGDSAAEGDDSWSDVTVPMSATAHRFAAGHRLRVQISGGAHPRFARNVGTGEPWASATRMAAVTIEIAHGPGQPGVLSLPTG